ncbi:hypothetical protein M9H77_28894 [Catharanthus roseus]|uniref:Uncharacterized protein n=1 Tax=Catharanthus roseus TaxID=4058 RepID=A0ACC0AH91_CATRO|nr:hypothetical protein M9H77_28894 [Catharanthus roseus]
MASTTSNSRVHSESASSRSPPPVKEEQDVWSKTVVTEELKKESVKKPRLDMDGQENMDKNEKYVADYTRYLKAKYFSDKTIFGGNIYDVKMTSDGQTVKASRLAPFESFADPAKFLALVSKPAEKTTAETSTTAGKQTPKKSN